MILISKLLVALPEMRKELTFSRARDVILLITLLLRSLLALVIIIKYYTDNAYLDLIESGFKSVTLENKVLFSSKQDPRY